MDEIVFELLRRTGAYEFHAAWGTGAEQALANLDKLLHLARAFATEGSPGLGAFVRWAQAATGQRAQVSRPQVILKEVNGVTCEPVERTLLVTCGGRDQCPAGEGTGPVCGCPEGTCPVVPRPEGCSILLSPKPVPYSLED